MARLTYGPFSVQANLDDLRREGAETRQKLNAQWRQHMERERKPMTPEEFRIAVDKVREKAQQARDCLEAGHKALMESSKPIGKQVRSKRLSKPLESEPIGKQPKGEKMRK